MSTSTFRTAVVRTPAGPDSIEIIDVPVVEPGPGEVRVEIAAAPVNPVDLAVAAGVLPRDGADQPARAHRPGLGLRRHRRRHRPGRGPCRSAPGSPAWWTASTATSAPTPSSSSCRPRDLAVVPDGLDLVAASTVPLNGLAAAQIVDLLGDAPTDGNRLLVTGAAGAVGGYVASLAQDRGWQVTGLARAEDEEFVRGLGADFTTHAEPGWDAVADGAALQERGLALVRDGGAFVGVQPSAEPATERGVTVGGRGSAPRRRSTGRAARSHRVAASCRPEYTRSSRWTRSPTPTAPWPRAGCAAATCSSLDTGSGLDARAEKLSRP